MSVAGAGSIPAGTPLGELRVAESLGSRSAEAPVKSPDRAPKASLAQTFPFPKHFLAVCPRAKPRSAPKHFPSTNSQSHCKIPNPSKVEIFILDTYKKFEIHQHQLKGHLEHNIPSKMSLPASFDLTPEDAKLLLAANVHLGSKNVQVCSINIMLNIEFEVWN